VPKLKILILCMKKLTQTHKHTKYFLYTIYLLLGGIFISNVNYTQVLSIVNGGISIDTSGYGIYNGSGYLKEHTIVSQGPKTLDFKTTTTDGFSVDGSSFSVDGANHRVGVKTTTPKSSLDVSGSFSLPVRHVIGAPANITLDENDHTVIIPNASSPVIYLPSSNSCPGRIYHIIRKNTGWGTIRGGYLTYNGGANAYGQGLLVLQSVGSYWQQIN